MDSTVAKLLTGTNCKLANEKDLQSENPTSFTATISGASKIYNLFPGTVLFLGFYKNMGTVTVAVSNHEIVRYLNLKDIQGWNYCSVTKGQYVGETHPNNSFQFEYCTQWKGSSVYPVRVNNKLYYKQNPLDILNGLYAPENQISIKSGITRYNDKVKFTEAQAIELGPTSIDNSDTYVQGARIVTGG